MPKTLEQSETDLQHDPTEGLVSLRCEDENVAEVERIGLGAVRHSRLPEASTGLAHLYRSRKPKQVEYTMVSPFGMNSNATW